MVYRNGFAKAAVRLCGLLIVLAFTLSGSLAQEKKPFTPEDLAKHTYYFDIADNRLVGAGAEFLIGEVKKSQYLLLGEYHGSLRISEFTRALIPLAHDAGYRYLGLEVGPISVQILTELSRDAARTTPNLNAFNGKYAVTIKGEREGPIPFFNYVEDAAFLTEASQRKWKLLGLDQEYSFSYIPLLDRMYANLDTGRKTELADLYRKCIQSIQEYYAEDIRVGKSQFIAIHESAEVNRFLDAASEKSAANRAIADAIRTTTQIYRNNDLRHYYLANSDRIAYMKRNMSEGFKRAGFDIRKDKMILKMGGVHTGRGFSPLSLFEIGNTLSELAEVNGNRSLHINFTSRYYIAGDKEIDVLDDKQGFLYRFQPLLQMAKKDQWTLIDLRPLREAVFYHRKYQLDAALLEWFRQHDLVLIPKQDKDPTLNIAIGTATFP